MNGRTQPLSCQARSECELFNPMSFYHSYFNRTLDFAYGVDDCLKLAAGTFKRDPIRYPRQPNSFPTCPDPNDPVNEGICDPNVAADNADSLSLISTGRFQRKFYNLSVPFR
jgi:hypothetical protein